uniref:Uncharacterized protein n=1 Tax=Rhizophora mucronata TaxID=61149 RepID=A0A2P2QCZ2_RHIMU
MQKWSNTLNALNLKRKKNSTWELNETSRYGQKTKRVRKVRLKTKTKSSPIKL